MKNDKTTTRLKEAKGSVLTPFKAIKYLFQKPHTLRYPFEAKEPSERYRGFHLNDWERCTGCGNCADICPNQAIDMVKIEEIEAKPGRRNERPRIDYGRCCFCGLCVDICPPGSLRLSKDYIHIDHSTDSFKYIAKDEKTEQESFVPADNYSVLNASLAHRKVDYEGFVSDLEHCLFETERVHMPEVEADERKLSFMEQVIGYSREEARKEAERCLECKLCEEACPAHMKISDYIDAIYEDMPDESMRKILEDNPLPSICGRICTRHCEKVCSVGIRGESLAIRWLKRFAADSVRDYKEAVEQNVSKPTGKRVAIIGAGPSGLSLAYFLRLRGHDITVFDALPAGGGTMLIGPPLYRLPREAIERDVNNIASLGVEFMFNTKVGKDVMFKDLLDKYDAVFIGIGTSKSRSTGIKNADKCILALDFLRENKIGKGTKISKQVIVIGGGNVAMDVARVALRLQNMQYPNEETAIKTVSLEDWDIMPASEDEIQEAKEEGVQFNPAWGPEEVVLDDEGNIKGLSCKKVKSVFDENGRFAPILYEDQKMLIEGDMIIEAIGQAPDFSFIPEELFKELKFTSRRKVDVDENGMTSIPKVFAGGDIVNTNLDAITAIADAKRAAQGIDNFLRKEV